MKFLLPLLLSALTCCASTVTFTITNSDTTPYTGPVSVYPISSNILADGSFTIRGIATKLQCTNSLGSTKLMRGTYAAVAPGYTRCFAVPLDTGTYSADANALPGANIFVYRPGVSQETVAAMIAAAGSTNGGGNATNVALRPSPSIIVQTNAPGDWTPALSDSATNFINAAAAAAAQRATNSLASTNDVAEQIDAAALDPMGDWEAGTIRAQQLISTNIAGNGGSLTNPAGYPLAGLNTVTDVVDTAMSTISISADQLDTQTWLSLLSANYGASQSLNRYGTSNTFYRIKHQMPITVLFLSDGLGDEPPTNSIFQRVYQELARTYGVGGYIMMTPQGYARALFEPATAEYFGANNSFARGEDWLWGVYLTNDGSGFSYTMPDDLQADRFGVGWVSRPSGGNITVKTNHVTMATLSGYSAALSGNWLWWTNTGRSGGMLIEIINSGDGTNAVFGIAAIDSTSKGVIVARQTSQSSDVGKYRTCAESVRSPVYKAWNPDLVLCDYFTYTNNPTMTTDLAATLYWFRTNTPSADFVLCSSFNCPANFEFDAPTMASIARTNGFGYFDGWGIFSDWQTMIARGFLNQDQAHLTADGYGFWGGSFWNWLGLTEDHAQPALAAAGANTNSPTFTGTTTLRGDDVNDILDIRSLTGTKLLWVSKAGVLNGTAEGLTNLPAANLTGTLPAGALTPIGAKRVLPLNTPTRLVFDGDSLTAGYLINGQAYPYWLTNLWLANQSQAVWGTNAAVSGEPVSVMWHNYTNLIQPFKPSGGTNAILFLWAGINDIYYNTNTTAQIFANWSNYIAVAKADGFTTVGFTLPTAIYGSFHQIDPARAALNAMILNSGLCDYVVRLDKLFPVFNSTNYVDNLHFTTNCQALIAANVFATLLLPSGATVDTPSGDVGANHLQVENGARIFNGESDAVAMRVHGKSGGQTTNVLEIMNGGSLVQSWWDGNYCFHAPKVFAGNACGVGGFGIGASGDWLNTIGAYTGLWSDGGVDIYVRLYTVDSWMWDNKRNFKALGPYGVFADNMIATNGYVLPQLSAIPTNAIASAGAIATASVTNAALLNLPNTINGGGWQLVATNTVNGGYILGKVPVTWSTY